MIDLLMVLLGLTKSKESNEIEEAEENRYCEECGYDVIYSNRSCFFEDILIDSYEDGEYNLDDGWCDNRNYGECERCRHYDELLSPRCSVYEELISEYGIK